MIAPMIMSMLDLEALCGAEDVEAAAKQAVETVKKENGYLFETDRPPVYARSTGTNIQQPEAPATLAGALRERFEKKK